jgi:hypothetical protein
MEAMLSMQSIPVRAKGADSQSEVNSSESEAGASGYQSGIFS